MLIRRATAVDREDARRIQAEAFSRPGGPVPPPEVAVLDALIDDGDVIDELTFVALSDRAPVGHVMCSRAVVGSRGVVALGPIGVLPEHQGRGVGQALVHAALAAADARGAPLVALLGSRRFYGRFGFVPASTLGIAAPEAEWGDHFQVRALAAYDPAIVGAFEYAPAFSLV